MNLLVTGGAGFIGGSFVRTALRSAAWKVGTVVNLDLLTYAGCRASLADLDGDDRHVFVHGDIRDATLVGTLLREHRIDAVLNFAAESHVDRSIDSPEPFLATNVLGVQRLLDSARSYWQGLESCRKEGFRFLHVSTDEVYGSLRPGEAAFTELTPYAPNSPYAASKAAADFLVRACFRTHGLPVLTTNCSNNYGPYQFPEKLIPLMIRNAIEGKPLPVYGRGENVRDWLFVDDHVRAIWVVLQGGKPGETYNIGGATEKTNLEIVDAVCRTLDELRPDPGGAHRRLATFVADRPGHDLRYAIDFSKLTRDLGWRPSESFQSGLRRTVQWYLDHASWCEEAERRVKGRERLGLGA